MFKLLRGIRARNTCACVNGTSVLQLAGKVMALTNLFLNLKPKLSPVSYTSSLKNVVINPATPDWKQRK